MTTTSRDQISNRDLLIVKENGNVCIFIIFQNRKTATYETHIILIIIQYGAHKEMLMMVTKNWNVRSQTSRILLRTYGSVIFTARLSEPRAENINLFSKHE